jgi:very-short-patch-repair endonuclease
VDNESGVAISKRQASQNETGPARYIVRGATTRPEKKALARDLRRRRTRAEEALWQALRGNTLNSLRFRRQQVISGYVVDFYCFAASLVVEVDGEIHERQREYDADRDTALKDRGLHVLRFTNDQVLNDLPYVLASIQVATSAATPPPSSLSPHRGEDRRGVPADAASAGR